MFNRSLDERKDSQLTDILTNVVERGVSCISYQVVVNNLPSRKDNYLFIYL